MVQIKYYVIILTVLVIISCQQCPYGQYYKFVQKQNTTPYPLIPNPYQNPSQQYLKLVNQNLHNKFRVCAIQYLLDDKSKYRLKSFQSKQQALKSNWIITHQGRCGACSSTKDLFVYLSTDLTKPVRMCGVKHFYSKQNLRICIKNLGFTEECTEVWLWNTLYTKKQCGLICMWSLLTKQPYVMNDHLNKCLQCDQDKSGPIFKYESGRTRRNSGIHSQIDRPEDQIYNITHCYY